MDSINEFLDGLSADDASAAQADLMFFGSAFVIVDPDGCKRRIEPSEVFIEKPKDKVKD